MIIRALQLPPAYTPLRASGAVSPGDPQDGVTLSGRLLGERLRTRWQASVVDSPTAAVPSPDGQGMLLEAHGAQHRIGAGGEVHALAPKAVQGTHQSRSAVLADGSEVVFSWDMRERGNFEKIALTRVSGEQTLWKHDLGVRFWQSTDTPISWPPVAMPNGSFLVGRNGVECLSAEGNQLWSCPGEIYGNFNVMPSVAQDGSAYVVQNYMQGGLYGRSQSRLHGYRPDGSHWQRHMGSIHCSPAISEDGGAIVVYTDDSGTRVEKITPDGKPVWNQRLPSGQGFSAVLEDSNGFVLLCRRQDPALICFDPVSNQVEWEAQLPAEPLGLPVRLPDGDLLVASADGKVTCLADNYTTATPALSHSGGVETAGKWVVVGGVRVPRRRS